MEPKDDRRFERFALVLVTDHACNLRCSYCYTGEKAGRRMSLDVGREAIARAVRSVRPGGTLELSFFGGEPLLDPELLLALASEAAVAARPARVRTRLGLTTNGTQASVDAWAFMMRPDLDLAVSCDGLAEVHDRHRRTSDGRGTSAAVFGTLRGLVAAGRAFRVVTVVRPDTVESLCAGVRELRRLGVRWFEPSLDLWASWTDEDLDRLDEAIHGLANLWADGLPDGGIGWFDDALARLGRLPVEPTARCGYGVGSVAVAPSGRLYPCERLVGADRPSNGAALAGNVFASTDFLEAAVGRYEPSADACPSCVLRPSCGADCPCSNYVRTGDPRRPDGLLCLLERSCTAAVASRLARPEDVSPREVA